MLTTSALPLHYETSEEKRELGSRTPKEEAGKMPALRVSGDEFGELGGTGAQLAARLQTKMAT